MTRLICKSRCTSYWAKLLRLVCTLRNVRISHTPSWYSTIITIPSIFLRYRKASSVTGFVKISAVCSLVSMCINLMIFFWTNLRKWLYLIEICFVLGVNFGYSVTLMQVVLSSKTWQDTSGVGSCTGKTRDIFFIRNMKGTTSLIALDSAMYSASVVDSTISVCSLLLHNTGQPA